MIKPTHSRREVFGNFAALFAGAASARAQGSSPNLPPREELVNTFDFEDVAKLRLSEEAYATIAGSDRAAFDRMTFRPRRMIPTVDMDLSSELFGDRHFTPILVGPVDEQRQYHPDGELEAVRGAAAGRAGVVVSSRSSAPIAEIAAEARTPLWYSVPADSDALEQARRGVRAGCRIVCIDLGRSDRTPGTSVDWGILDQTRRGLDVPVVLKGVMKPGDAENAVERGFDGIVVSSHGAVADAVGAPISVLPSIVDAVGGRATILIDGSFRRGSDILKAMILGARGVMVARPVMWGLAAYGADGVQSVLELLQSAFARNMGSIGAPDLASLDRSMVRIDTR